MSLDDENIIKIEIEFDKCLSNQEINSIDYTILILKNLLDNYLDKQKWIKLHDLTNRINNQLNFQEKDQLCQAVGDFFASLNEIPKALGFYKKATLANESNLIAYQSYENCVNCLIDRWHYRMINDQVRNAAYFNAIQNKLRKRNSPTLRIIDIGSGTGLLSAQCFYFYKPFVFACETNTLFHEISENFLKNHKKNYKLIKKHSSDITKNDLDSSKIDLIVTEIFDDGLLGENCLQTLYDFVVKRELVQKSFEIIPQYAKIYVFGIECEFIRKSSIFSAMINSKKISILSNDGTQAFSRGSNDKFEPYTTEDLNTLEYEKLTEIMLLDDFIINFNDIQFLRDICENKKEFKRDVKLKCIKNGYLDALVICFDLFLDANIHISTLPWSNNQSKCWHQAIFSVYDRFSRVNANQTIDFTLEMTRNCFLIEKKAKLDQELVLFYAKRSQISCLNNFNYQNLYLKMFNEVIERENINKIGYYGDTLSLFLLKLVFGEYSCAVGKQIIIIRKSKSGDLSEFLRENPREFIKIISMEELEDEQIDFMIVDPIDYELGILKDDLIADLNTLRLSQTHLNDQIFPKNLGIYGFFIESDELMQESTLTSNKNLFIDKNLDLKVILDEYKTRNYYNITTSRLRFKKLSEEIKILDVDFFKNTEISCDLQLKIINKGKITAFLYYFTIEDCVEMKLPNAAIIFYNSHTVDPSKKAFLRINASLKQTFLLIKIY